MRKQMRFLKQPPASCNPKMNPVSLNAIPTAFPVTKSCGAVLISSKFLSERIRWRVQRNKLLIPVGAVRMTDGRGGLLNHDYGGERGVWESGGSRWGPVHAPGRVVLPAQKGCPGARPRGPVGVRARFSRAPAGGARGGRGAARTRGEPARGAEGEERRGWRGRGLLRVPPGRRASLSAGSEAGGRRGSRRRRRRRRWRAAGAGAWLWLRVLGDKMAAALWRLVSSSSPLSSAPPLAASSVSSSSSSLAASSSSCSSPSDRRSAGPLSRSSGGG
ncbi:protein argonaute 14-like [Mustela erminea]|uniref:protein argonaute 14-like n=1 Tax=Mustela erminea TaxID=36723 RepID=UPI00138683FE|nr:protein argonaute 14-like [Mustela erminea]